MINEELAEDEDSIDNELLRNVVKCEENVPKRRRMSVNVFKLKKSQHSINIDDLKSESLTNDDSIKHLKIPKLWQSLARRTLMLSDPFRTFKLSELPTEKVIRYLYNSITKSWKTDTAIVKMEKEAFNRGAMRECFRLKKISPFYGNDWKRAGNFVSKRYMENVEREVYFEDVCLQMDAKLWAEEFNRQPGVKKEVDIVRMSIIEFADRPDKPLYHLEHFIEGNYIKYNSNSGFVDDRNRNTPQAFSHFTFERSGHELIVVDIQGVGDLYTDPQIHTSCRNGYGNGNLGPRGMALFFHSHKCNNVCEALGLAKFDLAPSELKNLQSSRGSSITSDTIAVYQRTPLRSLRSSKPSNSLESALIDMLEEHLNEDSTEQIHHVIECLTQCAGDQNERKNKILQFQVSSPDSGYDNDEDVCLNLAEDLSPSQKDTCEHNLKKKARFKFDSSNSNDMKKDEDSLDVYMNRNHIHRPSCAASTDICSLRMGESILGEIHHEIANMHETGRFTNRVLLDESINWEAVLYHEDIAATLNCMEAILNMANYHLGLPPRDLLKACTIQPDPDKKFKGWIYLTKAANAGHRPSIMALADANDVEQSKIHGSDPDWNSVYHWLERTLETIDQSDENGEFDNTNDNPSYVVKARMAAMLRTGGYGLDKDTEHAAELYSEAGDEATTAMKGRLASKYYELSEEVYGEME